YLMIAAIFLAMPYAYRQGANIRVTFLVERLGRPTRLVIDHVVQIVSILYCAVLVVATFQQARHMRSTNTTFVTIEIALWPAYVLTTIPMFILMAYFSASGGLARDLYIAGAHWLSRVKGGLAIATVFACGIFGAMSGASLAAAAVMSSIAMPEMRRHGYSDELAAGAIGIGATLDILIPPSVGMVIYGISTQTSIGKLLIAGVIPGIIVAIFLVLAILV